MKLRRKKVTLKYAHDWRQRGIGGGVNETDFIQKVEADKIINNVIKEIEEITLKQFPRTANLELAIIKGHLIVEYAITQFIRCMSNVLFDFEDIEFTFFQKTKIAEMMGLAYGDPVLFPTIGLFNQLRNQAAHKFIIQRELIDQMIALNAIDYKVSVKTDRGRIKYLRGISANICGRIAGRLAAVHGL
jgi:hypothetical protein